MWYFEPHGILTQSIFIHCILNPFIEKWTYGIKLNHHGIWSPLISNQETVQGSIYHLVRGFDIQKCTIPVVLDILCMVLYSSCDKYRPLYKLDSHHMTQFFKPLRSCIFPFPFPSLISGWIFDMEFLWISIHYMYKITNFVFQFRCAPHSC
jgi:hypothetical protein